MVVRPEPIDAKLTADCRGNELEPAKLAVLKNMSVGKAPKDAEAID